MEGKSQVIALWVGSHSQKTAHHFYALQSQQFFDQSEDPTDHHALWTFKDKYMNQRYPRTLIFDTESDHLTQIRKVNHKKILKKMSEPSKDNSFFPFQFLPQTKTQEEKEQFDPNQWMFQNWSATEDNYVLIDRNYNQMRTSFQLWEELFKFKCDLYEDKIRKQLQKTDFLRLFTLCSDADRLGFTTKLVQYLRDECPKRSIVMTNLSDQKIDKYHSECFLPLIGQLATQVDFLLDFNMQPLAYPYFQGDNFYHNISPVLNSLYTPFMLKDANPEDFFLKMQQDNKTLFNIGSTLPVIDEDMKLHQQTNIVQYLPKLQVKTTKAQQILLTDRENRVNFANSSFLNVFQEQKSKKISAEQLQKIKPTSKGVLTQSFVFKGQFNEIADLFKDKNNNYEIKYLKGILAGNPKANLKYDQFYRPFYNQIVQNYPFHTVLFQHTSFGPSLRNYLKIHAGVNTGSELLSEWKQSILGQADLYSQKLSEDSD